MQTTQSGTKRSLSQAKSTKGFFQNQKFGVDTVEELDLKIQMLRKKNLARQLRVRRMMQYQREEYNNPKVIEENRQINHIHSMSLDSNATLENLNTSKKQKQQEMMLSTKIFSINRNKVISSLGGRSTRYKTTRFQDNQEAPGKHVKSKSNSQNLFKISSKNNLPKKLLSGRGDRVGDILSLTQNQISPEVDELVQSQGLELVNFVRFRK